MTWHIIAVIILGMGSANERQCYNVTSSLIGWAHTWNDYYIGARASTATIMTEYGSHISSDGLLSSFSGTLYHQGHKHGGNHTLIVHVPVKQPWRFGVNESHESTENGYMADAKNQCYSSLRHIHYSDVIMGSMASQITSLTIVYSIVYSGADQRKHQSSASLAFVRGIHRWPVNSPHKWPVTRKMFPFDDVIMEYVAWWSLW